MSTCFWPPDHPSAGLIHLNEHQPSPYLTSLLAHFSSTFPPDTSTATNQIQLSPQKSLDALSQRELEILQLIAVGASNEEIAAQLINRL